MPPGENSLLIRFGRAGDCDAFVREGWRRAESEHRWTAGARSVLVLPPFAPSRQFALMFLCWPVQIPGLRQTLALEFNGVRIGDELTPSFGVPNMLFVPGELVNRDSENTLVWLHPRAVAPAGRVPGSVETRTLAFAWRQLEFAPYETTPFPQAKPLPDVNESALPVAEVAGLYQSLGQNCELGVFQRRCGVEPQGLLRFADISPYRLMLGLTSRFAGIADPDALSLETNPGGTLDGRHSVYGLHYHTFKKGSEVDLADFRVKQSKRLGYLARLLLEEIENDEKIFVRRGGFETDSEMFALHRLLQRFNPRARLLVVREAPLFAPESAGLVERVAPHLYRGFLASFADPDRVNTTLPFEGWLKICGVLYASQRDRGAGEA